MTRGALVAGSLVVHGAFFVGLGVVRAPDAPSVTAIEVITSSPPVPAPEPAPEPVAPKEALPPLPTKAAPVPAAAPTPKETAPLTETAPLGDAPDLGLELSGNTGGNGVAVPAPRAATSAAPSPTSVRRTLTATPRPSSTSDTCEDPPAKPKLVELPQPGYTDAARAAGVEGKVRIEITVDETGKVVDAKALSSLGHGLDEAALAAARAAKFSPALRCGRPSRSTFTLAIRFSA